MFSRLVKLILEAFNNVLSSGGADYGAEVGGPSSPLPCLQHLVDHRLFGHPDDWLSLDSLGRPELLLLLSARRSTGRPAG